MVAASGYDANGNLISDGVRTFSYDVENRLTGVTGGASPLAISYDPLGRIATVTAGGAATRFVYDGQRLTGEVNAATGALLRSYVHGLGVDQPRLWLEGHQNRECRDGSTIPRRLEHVRRKWRPVPPPDGL